MSHPGLPMLAGGFVAAAAETYGVALRISSSHPGQAKDASPASARNDNSLQFCDFALGHFGSSAPAGVALRSTPSGGSRSPVPRTART